MTGIETASDATAACIADALGQFGEQDFEVAPLFAALEDCLTAYGIPSVQLNFGKLKYLMVPA